MINKELIKKIKKMTPEAIFPAPFVRNFNATFTVFQEGKAEAEITVKKEYTNPFGIAHGGFLFTLLDEVLGMAAFSIMDKPFYQDIKSHTTINHEIQFIGPAKLNETIVISSNIKSARKNIIFMEGEIRAKDNNKYIASSKGIWFIKR